jgi:S-adenosylmethionine decarboxylase proenzyme
VTTPNHTERRLIAMNALGRHILTELYGCDARILDDLNAVKRAMEEAAVKSRATIVGSHFHRFSPQGVSGVVVIAESHLAIHTWPEYSFAAVDLFTCGHTVDPWIAFDSLKDAFRAADAHVEELERGKMAHPAMHALDAHF